MTQTDTQQACREAFEDWCVEFAHENQKLRKDVQNEAAWDAWKAAWQAAQQQVKKGEQNHAAK